MIEQFWWTPDIYPSQTKRLLKKDWQVHGYESDLLKRLIILPPTSVNTGPGPRLHVLSHVITAFKLYVSVNAIHKVALRAFLKVVSHYCL